jgi:alcohol dehydrogenase
LPDKQRIAEKIARLRLIIPIHPPQLLCCAGRVGAKPLIWEKEKIMRPLVRDVAYDIHRIFDFATAGMVAPNRIIFGCGAIDKLGQEAARLGQGRALLISDAVLQNLGALDKIEANLKTGGFEVLMFANVEPEPHIELAETIFETFVKAGVGIVVGVGGGSVLDITKLMAMSLAHKIPPRRYCLAEVDPEPKGLPLILAPTTSGTGSELGSYSVVTIDHAKKPFYVTYADIAIVDPELTVSMPAYVTAYTGMDAISHAIEAIMHKDANPIGDMLCLGGIELAGANLFRAVADGEDLEARYHMSMAASLGYMGMNMTGVVYAHSASYVIGQYKPTPHGLGCALALPYSMAYNISYSSAKLARIAAALGGQTDALSEQQAAKLAVDSIYHLLEDIGLPTTLKQCGAIAESDLTAAAEIMIEKYPRPENPRPMDRHQAIRFWRSMWEGDLWF